MSLDDGEKVLVADVEGDSGDEADHGVSATRGVEFAGEEEEDEAFDFGGSARRNVSRDVVTGRPVEYRFPIKKGILAGFLLVVGIGALIAAAVEGSLTILLLGVLATLPGAYQSFILYQTWRRNPRYPVQNVYEMVEL